MADDNGWLEPSDTGGLWEHQGTPLTVRWLMAALGQVLTDDLSVSGPIVQLLRAATTAPSAQIPVQVEFYDGATSPSTWG